MGRRPQQFTQFGGAYAAEFAHLGARDAPRQLPRHPGQPALQFAHPRLPRVFGHDRLDRPVGDRGREELEAVPGDLFGPQELLGDHLFLRVQIAGQADHLHPVAQRSRYLPKGVGGGEEEHVGEIEFKLQVMVGEGSVLLGIENLEQRRPGIPMKIAGQLVHFVEQKDRIARSAPAETLDDPPWQRADVGPAMTPDFGLVAHPTQAHPNEFPLQASRDTPAERGLSDPRRPDQAQDRPLQPPHQGKHRDVVQDPLLDLLQAVVLLLEHTRGPVHVQAVLGLMLPGQGEDPVQVGANHRCFRGDRIQPAEAIELLVHAALHLVGQGRFRDRDLQLRPFRIGGRLLAVQSPGGVLPVGRGSAEFGLHLEADLLVQLLLDLKDLDFPDEDRLQDFETSPDFRGFEQFLPLARADQKMAGDQVRQAQPVSDFGDRRDHLVRDLLRETDVLPE